MDSFETLLRGANSRHASDVHFSAGAPPTGRIDGQLINLCDERLTPNMINVFADELMDEYQQAMFRENGEVDFAHSVTDVGRFRINIFKQRGSTAIAARILNAKIPHPEDLGIPQCVVDMTKKRRGLVLVTGATGSGKSTTLASLINIINQTYHYHVLTLEDPVEYLHRHCSSIVNQREIGNDSRNYASALRAALRQDPDVVLVGEMRDLETISIAVTAAETGHLVFSTLHTIGAANTIDRIIDVFPPYQQQQIRTQLADVLECVVSQQLLAKKGGDGRIAAMEVMVVNSAIRNLIREGKTFQIPSIIQTNRKLGMITMDDALFELYQTGEISIDAVLNYSQDRNYLSKKLL